MIEVRRKLGGVNRESRTLIDVFNMATNSILPGVESVTLGLYSTKHASRTKVLLILLLDMKYNQNKFNKIY